MPRGFLDERLRRTLGEISCSSLRINFLVIGSGMACREIKLCLHQDQPPLPVALLGFLLIALGLTQAVPPMMFYAARAVRLFDRCFQSNAQPWSNFSAYAWREVDGYAVFVLSSAVGKPDLTVGVPLHIPKTGVVAFLERQGLRPAGGRPSLPRSPAR